jgi:hypothetical protein
MRDPKTYKNGARKKRWNAVLSAIGFLILAGHLAGSSFFFAGTLATPEDTFTESFIVPIAQNIRITTWGFGGGTVAGNVVSPGGFDPLVALYSGDLSTASIVSVGGNPAADADTLSSFVANCPPAGFVTIGTGAGNSVCGDDSLIVPLAAGIYTLLLSDANYIPLSVDPGPPSSSLLSDGFTDFTGGVFQTCNTTSDGTFCITPTGNYAVELQGSADRGPELVPEPGAWALMGTGLAAFMAMKKKAIRRKQ